MNIELLEPGLAIPKGRGYVGVGDKSDTISFPHIDSCMGIIGIFEDGTIIGGHAGAQWPGTNKVDYLFSGNRIFTLMEANRNRVKPGELQTMVFIYPADNGGWQAVEVMICKTWRPQAFLEIDTSSASKGVNVLVTHTSVTIEDCLSKRTTAYDLLYDAGDIENKKF